MTERERRELIRDIQAAVQRKLDDPWIMESPDGGKTVSKRKFGEKDKFYLNNVNGKWYSYEQALEAARQRDHEEQLRAEHPTLADAYNTYQELLSVLESDIAKNQ